MGDLYTIKTPSGHLDKPSCRSSKVEAIEDYIHSGIRHGFMVDLEDLHGPAFYWRYWPMLRRAGYSIVRIRVTMLVDEEHGFRVPELHEVAA